MEICVCSCAINAILIYRPPYSKINPEITSMFLGEFTKFPSRVLQQNNDPVSLDDFNIPVNKQELPEVKNFMEL